MGLLHVLHYFPWLILSVGLWMASPLSGQQTQKDQLKNGHHEVQDQKFVPIDRAAMPVSPAYRIERGNFFSVQVNVNSNGENIVGDAANEPSIAVDLSNPNRMAIGWRQFNTISNSFRQAGYGYTTNGGQSWTFPGVIQPGIFRSDPVLDSDSTGNFYYNSLTSSSGNYSCQVFRSSTGGSTWDAGTFAQGGDKQWMIIDRTHSVGNGNIYSSWTSYYSSCYPDFFTRSVDGGDLYEPCELIPEDPFWGTLAVGPDGELYVGGVAGQQISGFVVAKSLTARDSDDVVMWNTPSFVDLDGDLSFSTGPNPGGLLGQTWIATDQSDGSGRGNVYILASVDRQLTIGDPLDVMFAKSTDGGETWTSAHRVNDDVSTTAWQWFGTMSVAPTGRIDVVWLDTRDNPGTYLSSLYYVYSTDEGESWAPNIRLSDAFNPHLGWPQQSKMGDYFHMISDSNGAHLAWAATFGGEQNVYYGRISFPLVGIADKPGRHPTAFSLGQNFPNPFNPSTQIEFRLPGAQHVTLTIFNVLGQEVRRLADGVAPAGLNRITWNGLNDAGTAVTSGLYVYRLDVAGRSETRKMLLIR